MSRERLQDFHREVSLVLVASTLCRYPFIGGSASSSLWPHVRVLLLCAKDLFVAAIRQPGRGFRTSQSPPPRQSRVSRTRVQNFDLSQRFWCRGLWGLGFNE